MTLRRTLLAPVSPAVALVRTSVIARMDAAIFKGISEHFTVDKDKNIDNTMYSPTFGMVALEVGLIENIRLYGNYMPGIGRDGKRLYTKDTSDDPLCNVVNILFPTNAGVLNAETAAISSFGKYVTKPETVALLVNFAKKIYDADKDMTDNEIAGNVGKEIIETLDGAKNLNDRNSASLSKNVNNLLRYIQSAIGFEKENKSLYPKYTTVQMIQAFLCCKFNSKDHIAEELRHLDKSMVDGEKLSADLLIKDDLKVIIKKDTRDIDDLFGLTQASLFMSLTPYQDGIALLSNELVWSYDRATKELNDNCFADCVIIAIRHLCNLLFFNAKTRAFDVPGANKNLKNCYAEQTPFHANSGNEVMRSLWIAVVGGLNTKNDTDPIIYDTISSVVDEGFGNIIKILSKLLKITFDPIPSNTLKNKTTWLQTSLQKLLDAMNPSYMYEVKLSKLKNYKKDIVGTASITVKEKIATTKEGQRG